MSAKENPPPNKPAVQVFRPREIGESLNRISVEYLKTESQDVESIWFHGKHESDLFIWQDKKKNIIKQQICFYGQFAEWNIIEGLRTGLLIDDDNSKSMTGSSLVHFDSEPQMKTVEQGIQILGHVSGLTPVERSVLVENFIKSPLFSSMSHEELIRRFGSYLNQAGASASPNWSVSMGARFLLRRLLNLLGFSGK